MSYKELTPEQQVTKLEEHFKVLFQAIQGMDKENTKAIDAYLISRQRLYKDRNLQFLYGRRDILQQLMAIIEARK